MLRNLHTRNINKYEPGRIILRAAKSSRHFFNFESFWLEYNAAIVAKYYFYLSPSSAISRNNLGKINHGNDCS